MRLGQPVKGSVEELKVKGATWCALECAACHAATASYLLLRQVLHPPAWPKRPAPT